MRRSDLIKICRKDVNADIVGLPIVAEESERQTE